ncbi:hypothetical protein EV193_102689 [Herbihabitans rhizosphaerae]|uniref:Alpha/beta hydrolase family protein n=1 Tax=Herbihabitans rhizosphaerae TaxID=1872711 RepID=A0A4Q7L2D0_9PSEU|nr:hypothetical protein [Herbihabitans rhizosphaerae]RZS43708.1 hypothetical protein EV193_102689 [Herbihabitans rhizosphaerae]
MTDSVTLATRDRGEGSPVVLLHGLGLDATTWDTFAGALAAAGRRVRRGSLGPRRQPAHELPFDWPVVPSSRREMRRPDPRWWTALSTVDMTTSTGTRRPSSAPSSCRS